ncbi:hypothetical protein ACVW0P_000126 [Mucilaginibacter sp. UYNi724]
MTFEEFFNKKRIDLVALRAAEPGLFTEFEKHFTQMGEKSFDHTKKYWFNKLRLQYHPAPEQKPEKMHLENQLAEQTIVEALTESIPAPSTGFKPRFKPGMVSKPAPTSDVKDLPYKDSATSTPEVNEAAQTKDQNPPFQQEKAAMQDMADNTARTTDTGEVKAETPASKPGFKPRFNIKMTQGDGPQTKDFDKEVEPGKSSNEPEGSSEPTTPKPAFKPRFKMQMAAPKPADAEEVKPEAESAKEAIDPNPEVNVAAPKPGFKPRFNMKAMAPKPDEAEAAKAKELAEETKSAEEEKPAVEDAPVAPKVGFKPRFNAKTTKPQTPPQE